MTGKGIMLVRSNNETATSCTGFGDGDGDNILANGIVTSHSSTRVIYGRFVIRGRGSLSTMNNTVVAGNNGDLDSSEISCCGTHRFTRAVNN